MAAARVGDHEGLTGARTIRTWARVRSWVLHLARELTTGGVDVVATGLAHGRDDTGFQQHFGKACTRAFGLRVNPEAGKGLKESGSACTARGP